MRTVRLIAALIIGLLLVGACAPGPVAPPATQNLQTAPADGTTVKGTGPAVFTISNLSIYPQFPAPLAYAMVSVDVTNTGGEQGTYVVDVKVDGKTVATQNVTLAGGTSQTVKTGFDVGKVGTYTVSVGNLSLNMWIYAKMFSEQ